jgi:hypothetical protein
MIHISVKFFEIVRNVTAYSRVFTEKVTVAQLVAKLFAYHGTKKESVVLSQDHATNLHSKWLVTTKFHNKYILLIYIQGVTGGTDNTSGGCSLGQTIPI